MTAAPADLVRVVSTGARGMVIGFYDRRADSVLVLLDEGGLRRFRGVDLEPVQRLGGESGRTATEQDERQPGLSSCRPAGLIA